MMNMRVEWGKMEGSDGLFIVVDSDQLLIAQPILKRVQRTLMLWEGREKKLLANMDSDDESCATR